MAGKPNAFRQRNQRLMTMAALLHLDNNGYSLAAELIEKSGLTAEEWVSKYLDLYLMPLIHSFMNMTLYTCHTEKI